MVVLGFWLSFYSFAILPLEESIAQWSAPVRISEPGVCRWPQILAYGDSIHVIYTNIRGGEKISYVRSIDDGETWSAYRVLSDTLNTELAEFPRIIKTYGNKLMATWASFNYPGVYHYNIAYVISENGGVSWSAPAYIFQYNEENPITLAAANEGDIVNIIMGTWTGDSVGVFDIRSTNFGQTWRPRQLIFNLYGSGWRDCAASDSVVHLAWSGRHDQDHKIEIYYTRSIDNGVNWNSGIPLSDTDQYHSQLPAVATNQFANPYVAWMDYKHTPYFFTGDIFVRIGGDQGQNWTSEVQITERHFSTQSDIVAINDSIFVAWQDERSENGQYSIYYSYSYNNGSTWSEEYRLDADQMESSYPALGVSNGRVYAVWGDTRQPPDTSGLFFSRWMAAPDAVEDHDSQNLPEAIGLTAHPNPFNTSVAIIYRHAEGGDIKIINALGQLVKEFNINPFGGGQLIWDGKDAAGNPAASGVYFVRLQSGWQSRAISIICLR